MAIVFTGNAPDLFDNVPTTNHATQSRVGFASPEDLVRWLNSAETERSRWSTYGHDDKGMTPGFYGNTDYATACRMVLEGWPAGVERAAKLREHINATNPTAPRFTRYAMAGAYPNVPRYLSGNPLHMKALDNAATRRRPTVVLVAHYGALAHVDATNMERRAAAITAIVDATEAADFSCELIAYTVSDEAGANTAALTTCRLKDAGQPLDLTRVAFGLGHPAMLRRLTFAARAARPEARPLSNMGSTIYDKLTPPRGCYLIPAIQKLGESKFATDDRTATEGIAAIVAALRAQDCPAFRNP